MIPGSIPCPVVEHFSNVTLFIILYRLDYRVFCSYSVVCYIRRRPCPEYLPPIQDIGLNVPRDSKAYKEDEVFSLSLKLPIS